MLNYFILIEKEREREEKREISDLSRKQTNPSIHIWRSRRSLALGSDLLLHVIPFVLDANEAALQELHLLHERILHG